MDTANVIAVVGILTTGAVAITAQFFGHRREADARRHTERLQKDSEARSVLDRALASAMDARDALDEYAKAVWSLAGAKPGIPLYDELQQHVAAHQAAANGAPAKLRLDASRLIVRFGPSSAVSASYASLLLAYLDLLKHTAGLRLDLMLAATDMDPQTDATPESVAEVSKHFDRLVFDFANHAHEWANRDD